MHLHLIAEAAPTVVQVAVPWGSWAGDALNVASPVLRDLAYAAATALIGAVPVYLRPIYRQFVTNQVVGHAVDSAIARVSGAVKGREVSVDVASEVLRQAVTYVEAKEPAIVRWLGTMLIPRIQAQIVAAGLSPADSLGPPLPPKKVP